MTKKRRWRKPEHLGRENRRVKDLLAESELDKRILKDALEGID